MRCKNKNVIYPKTFYSMIIYNNETSKICPDLNPTAPSRGASQLEVNLQNCKLAKLSEVEAYFLIKLLKEKN